MSKKPIIGGIILAAIIGVVFVGAQINPDGSESIQNDNVAYHVTLADPALYDREDGLYTGYISGLEEGWYEFRFVASGDSPVTLSIELWDQVWCSDCLEKEQRVRVFSEDFDLQGTLVEDELSSWYVWDYSGKKKISFFDGRLTPDWNMQKKGIDSKPGWFQIIISPHRNYDGPVSIDLIKLD